MYSTKAGSCGLPGAGRPTNRFGRCLINQGKLMSHRSPLVVLLVCLLVLLGATADGDDGAKKIEIKDRKYAPAKLTIKVGQTVLWINRDDNDHTIVADDNSFKSEDLSRGESFKWTFKKVGKSKYHCKYHPREKGEVTVE